MPRKNVKDKRRVQLMEANIASIAKRGFANTTIAHISEGAKMSRGIVNFYFTSKENMMLQTLQFMDEELALAHAETMEAMPKANAKEKLMAYGQVFFSSRLCNQKRLAVWAAFAGHASTQNEYRKILAAGAERQKNHFTALLIDAGQAKDSAPLQAEMLLALIQGLWMSALLQNKAPARAEMGSTFAEFTERLVGSTGTNAETAKRPIAKPKPKVPAPLQQAMLFDDMPIKKTQN